MTTINPAASATTALEQTRPSARQPEENTSTRENRQTEEAKSTRESAETQESRQEEAYRRVEEKSVQNNTTSRRDNSPLGNNLDILA